VLQERSNDLAPYRTYIFVSSKFSNFNCLAKQRQALLAGNLTRDSQTDGVI
jgi:hypothetical protein